MIRLFTGKGRMLFFPKKWANAVSNWCLGVHSPSGTIDIRNTASPTQGGGATFDVNLEAVSQGVRERLGRTFASPRQVTDAIATAVDGSSLISRDGRLLVNDDWLKKYISANGGGGGTPESPAAKRTANVTDEGTSSANATSHAYDGTNGLQLTVCSRVMYDHTAATPVLYGFYRTWTFDKNGRLYSVSAETRYEIDTPVVGNVTAS